MTTPKKVSTATTAARLAPPAKASAESLASTTTQQVAAVMACTDYPNQPVVQGIVKTTQADNTSLLSVLAEIAQVRAQLPPLEAKRNTLMGAVRRDRHNLGGALTAICGGVPATIKAWGAIPGESAPTPATTDPPVDLKATSGKTPGLVSGRCAAVPRAATYFWALLSDPNASPTATPPYVTTGCRVSIPNQTTGKVMYLRVAVVRPRTGMSTWSEALQITVR
jgi:hypothetical protein